VSSRLRRHASASEHQAARTEAGYLGKLRLLLAHGKPVVVTEHGMRTYQGADRDGNLGTGITDPTTSLLHLVPIVGRLIRPRIKGRHVRDEAFQARRILEDLAHGEPASGRTSLAGALAGRWAVVRRASGTGPYRAGDLCSRAPGGDRHPLARAPVRCHRDLR
jgi:hypothetical protein